MAKSLDRYNAIFATGESGIGRATMLSMLNRLYYPNHSRGAVSQVSMHDIFNWCEDQGGSLGIDIRENASRMEFGEPMPFEVTHRAFFTWLAAEIQRNQKMETVFVSSLPLTNEFGTLALPFHAVSILHIKSASEPMPKGSLALNALPILPVNRDEPLSQRLERATHHLLRQKDPPLPANILMSGLKRLHDNQDPIFRKITSIDPDSAVKPSVIAEPVAV